MLERAPASWQAQADGLPFTGERSLLQPVMTPKHQAMLKLDAGSNDEIRRSAAMLRRYRGAGSIHLLRKQQNRFLLERVDGPSLCSLISGNQEELAADILADVVSKLHKPRRAKLPADLPRLEEHMQPLLAQRFNQNDPLLRHAARLMHCMIDTTRETAPLHGDLTFDHVLHHSQRGWLAIAPKGLLGDPHHEYAPAICDLCEKTDFSMLRSRLLARARRIGAHSQRSPDRLLTFAFCHACLRLIAAQRGDGNALFWRDLATTLLDCLSSDQQVF